MLRRLGYWLLTNILVILTITIIFTILPIGDYIVENGINYGALLIVSAVIGFIGSFVSLAISRWTAIIMMMVDVIDPYNPQNEHEARVDDILHSLLRVAGLVLN